MEIRRDRHSLLLLGSPLLAFTSRNRNVRVPCASSNCLAMGTPSPALKGWSRPNLGLGLSCQPLDRPFVPLYDDAGDLGAASLGEGLAAYLRLRQSTMKHVTAENAKRCEYVGPETRRKENRETY